MAESGRTPSPGDGRKVDGQEQVWTGEAWLPLSGRVCSACGKRPEGRCPASDNTLHVLPVEGRTLSPAEVLVKGLRKAVKDDRTEWVDANIVRLLLDRYDNPKDDDV